MQKPDALVDMKLNDYIKPTSLYLITDHDMADDARLFADAETAMAEGVKVLQYRDKSQDQQKRLRQARRLKTITARHNAILIINDDISLAALSGADGVHLGRDDDRISIARKRLGDEAIIGISCYNELQRARTATDNGADYLAFGRFFESRTKPDAPCAGPELISEARRFSRLPIVAIGGITPENARSLATAGVDMIAVINAVFGQTDIAQAIQNFNQVITNR